jgi:transcriptional regulator with XRE-family HTH domain
MKILAHGAVFLERVMIEFLNPVDVHVGARMRASRDFRNLELWELATAAKISTSRLIEYELGRTRCLPEHLAAIAEALNLRSSFFFEGLRKKVLGARLPASKPIIARALLVNDNIAGAKIRYAPHAP